MDLLNFVFHAGFHLNITCKAVTDLIKLNKDRFKQKILIALYINAPCEGAVSIEVYSRLLPEPASSSRLRTFIFLEALLFFAWKSLLPQKQKIHSNELSKIGDKLTKMLDIYISIQCLHEGSPSFERSRMGCATCCEIFLDPLRRFRPSCIVRFGIWYMYQGCYQDDHELRSCIEYDTPI